MSISVVFALVLAQVAFGLLLLWAFLCYDEPLARFEHRAWKKLRRCAKVIYGAILRRIGA